MLSSLLGHECEHDDEFDYIESWDEWRHNGRAWELKYCVPGEESIFGVNWDREIKSKCR
jgi:hypothetical protein